jgi:membrane associated rhomboid family serine protease
MAWRPEWEDDSNRGGGFMRPRGAGGWSTTTILLVIMVAVFLIDTVLERFEVDVVKDFLGLNSSNWFFLYPWFTYTLSHSTSDLGHLIPNALIIFFFGTTVEATVGRRRYLTLFFGAALIGALAYVVTLPLASSFVAGHPWAMIGASGAALALLFFVAWETPNARVIFIFIPLRVRTLAYILLAYDIYPILRYGWQPPDGVAHYCHLGGALTGWLFWKHRPDPFAWTGQARENLQQRGRERRQRSALEADAEMDRILKKINDEGMPSLTKAERKFLQERSKHLRDDSRR